MTAGVSRRDFAEMLLMTPPEPALAAPYDGRVAGIDPLEQMALADRADRSLLRLVACTAAATLVLALATTLF